MKKAKKTPPIKETISLRRIHKRTKTLIKIIATILAFTFTWLEFHDLSLTPMFTETFSNTLFKITLALFFLSWIIGVSKDLDDQEYVLLMAPNKGKLTLSAITIILTLGALFACLCIIETYQTFVIVLSGFFIFNIACWFYYRWFVRKALDESEQKYKIKNDSYGAFKIKTIRNFLWGKWQRDRFCIGFLILIVLNILAFSNLSQIISTKLDIPSHQFVIVLSFFIYIGVTEIWIWYVRLKRDITFELLEDLREESQSN